ncbi:hypothetical protein GW17_00048297 [Ensete ventricosum]|nr:hypothetical protein GW17_00048297 [Ensete ventricosum]
MADPKSPLHRSKLPPQALSTPSSSTHHFFSRKFHSSYLHKAVFFSVIIALVSIFPSRAPEFVNQSILSTTWELLHLLFVGIAISYGLFSRRNADFDAGKETSVKAETHDSYLSHVLHGSSVFDDDGFYSLHEILGETKTRTWSSQYRRNEPVVVIANESTESSHATGRPLFLPVRSLKSHIQDEMDVPPVSIDGTDESVESSEAGFGPSPVTWRSSSGRMEMMDEPGSSTGMVFPPSSSWSPPPPYLDDHPNLSKTPSFRSSKTPSPKRSSLSPQLRAKSGEEMRNTMTFYEFSPPPPPPPPPPFTCHGCPSTAHKEIIRKTFKDELKDLSRRVRTGGQASTDIVFDLFESATKPANSVDGSSVGRSLRTAVDPATKIDSEPFLGHEGEIVAVPPADNAAAAAAAAAQSSAKEHGFSSAAQTRGANENEVDKKADEFIAKFRKQITLQRSESAQLAAKC